jgi:hypothetical protein
MPMGMEEDTIGIIITVITGTKAIIRNRSHGIIPRRRKIRAPTKAWRAVSWVVSWAMKWAGAIRW